MPMNMNPAMNMNMNMTNVNMAQQNPAAQFTRYIYATLTQQNNTNPPQLGWKKEITLQERARQIKCLFDSLRMLSSAVDLKHSLDVAITFETKQFQTSATREQYQHSIHEKLARIRDERQNQINNASAAANNPMANSPANTRGPALQQAQQQLSQMQNLSFQHQMQQAAQAGMQQAVMSNQMNAQSTISVSSMPQPSIYSRPLTRLLSSRVTVMCSIPAWP